MKLRSKMPELMGEAAWLNGSVKRDDLVGKRPTIIHFWSMSCHECKEGFPQFNQFRKAFDERVNFIAVHMPRSQEDTDIGRIKKIARRYKITQPIFVDNQMTLTDLFNNQYVPSYYLFDQNGLLRHYQSGGSGMKMLEKRVLKLLNEKVDGI
ncbi:TlpA family protein disulfide reductase [Ureibacillus aquaedulcis]|uniref:TlpA disulfide reductase family protein n=1 Tax=Ureibacillus aquaedulcis TaxID=3058421 RepID=A0ABT8GLQ5_9BACL|nr:TlpA disulfide reductase family protein [Ureibacillus sp. BA0131]MDN4492352.1 TlpA disulfide reductase family protein [Ureibacillus sp. BA0131]